MSSSAKTSTRNDRKTSAGKGPRHEARTAAAVAAPTPAQGISRGVLQVTANGAWLVSGTDRIEILIASAAPANQAALDQARTRTVEQYKQCDGEVVALRGRRDENYLLASARLNRCQHTPKGAGAKAPARRPGPDFAAVVSALEKQRQMLLAIPGVLSARPGYLFQNGWITKEPAIVVTVRRRPGQAAAEAAAAVPRRIGAIPVDVRQAGPAEQALALARQAALTAAPTEQLQAAQAKLDLALPAWDQLPDALVARAEETVAALATPVHYQPPPNLTLGPATGPMKVTCNCSPDAGWAVLNEFLRGVEKRLTVAMYDFTAPHILIALKSAMGGVDGVLRLDLDPNTATGIGHGDLDHNAKAKDIPQTSVVQSLTRALRHRFVFTWAGVRHSGRSSGGLFKTAYHIKVAVRDGESFWLSSGNWQSSNQPDLDPLGPDRNFPNLQTMFDRDWHVVVEHEGLASTYEGFIEWDIEQATPLMTEAAAATEAPPPDLYLLVPDSLGAELAEPHFFAPQTISFTATDANPVMPLLTPDNYVEQITALVKSAQRTLYMQNQYINVPRGQSDPFTDLLDALKDRMDAGVDVKIILRGDFDTAPMLEALQHYGFDMSRVKLQKGLHNKGIIVDSQTVAVGSHNWSDAGVLFNRDATLIFHNEQVAQYFEQVFRYDWDNLAFQRVPEGDATALVVGANDPVPAGMVRIPWDVYYAD